MRVNARRAPGPVVGLIVLADPPGPSDCDGDSCADRETGIAEPGAKSIVPRPRQVWVCAHRVVLVTRVTCLPKGHPRLLQLSVIVAPEAPLTTSVSDFV